jgi:hypothetical protein
LNRAAALEAEAVAGHRVAEGARQTRHRLVAALGRGRPPNLFHEAELARLVSELRQEGRRARRRVDLELVHRGLEMG